MQMSKTQRKRLAYNYREAYFKKYPGLFGCIWFCSQCHKPLIGRKNVQVDHIWALGAGGVNRTFNTVAICAKCNRKKSAKTGLYLIHGGISKVSEVIMFGIRDILNTLFSLIPNRLKITIVILVIFYVLL